MKKIKPSNLLFMTAVGVVGCALLALNSSDCLAGIQGSGHRLAFAVGRITGFGSIFVDGVEFTTSGAQIVVDGQSASDAQLQIGQIVTVTGSLDSSGSGGAASVVSFTGDVEGPITHIDVQHNSFVVLGQTVIVTGNTRFGSALARGGMGALRVGASVTVSAFVNGTGDLVASRLDTKEAESVGQLKGRIESLDTHAQTFQINALTVDYSGIASMASLADGVVATVRGVPASGTDRLYATELQLSGKSAGSPDSIGKLEGLITIFNSPRDFAVGYQHVSTNSSTKFVLHGQSLQSNSEVSVQGTFDDSGTLVAQKVQVKSTIK
jgi:hypothetical protein